MEGTVYTIIPKEKGIYGYIKCPDKNYYYDNSSLTKGIYLKKGAKVEFDVAVQPDGREKAANIKLLSYAPIRDTIEKELLSDTAVQEILELLNTASMQKGYIPAATVPSILKKAGIDNFRIYTNSIEEFVISYFSDHYVFRKNVLIDEKKFPGVLINVSSEELLIVESPEITGGNAEKKPFEETGLSKSGITEDSRTNDFLLTPEFPLLDNLYENGRFAEYLRSPDFTTVSPGRVPIPYLEKAISCAEKLLYPDMAHSVTLNLFQKELLFCRTGKDFIKKWKSTDGYPGTIVSTCAQSSVCRMVLPEDNGNVAKLINAIGADTKPNNSYTSLTSRLEVSFNSLTPYFYVIRVMDCNSGKTAEKIIGEYCHYLKNIKKSNFSSRIDFQEELRVFQQFLNLVSREVMDTPMSRGTLINIVSVFLDLNHSNLLTGALSSSDLKANEEIRMMLEFLGDYSSWDEEQYQDLFGKEISLQLFEKVCATIWEKNEASTVLSQNYLLLMARVLKYCGREVIDEIIRLHYSSSLTKKQKELALVNSFHFITANIKEDDIWYCLALYIMEFVYPNIKNADLELLSEESLREIEKWAAVSNDFYESKKAALHPLSSENIQELLCLFDVFAMDERRESELQEWYSEWYSTQHGWWAGCLSEEIEKSLKEVYHNKAYHAYCFIYEYACDNNISLPLGYSRFYVDSLYQMRAYGKLIRYVQNTDTLEDDEKEKAMVRAVCGNFVKYGMSQRAFLIFDDNFTAENAIIVLNKNFNAMNFPLIISLIILYSKKGQLIKSVYLYMIYQSHA